MTVNPADAIYKLTYNVDVFMWLCRKCLGEKLTKGWSQLEKRPLPFSRPCQECVFKKEHKK